MNKIRGLISKGLFQVMESPSFLDFIDFFVWAAAGIFELLPKVQLQIPKQLILISCAA